MIGERLKRARAAAGLSMESLGKQAGVSAPMIQKYERDESMPSSSVLLKLATALNVRTEFFYRPTHLQLKEVEYRKQASTPQKVLNRITADVLDQSDRWFELKNLWPEFPVPEFSLPRCVPAQIASLEAVKRLSEDLRNEWQLGMDPIPDLIDLLESKGILVIVSREAHNTKFDGLQGQTKDSRCWLSPINGPAVVSVLLWRMSWAIC